MSTLLSGRKLKIIKRPALKDDLPFPQVLKESIKEQTIPFTILIK